ncbi:MAG TPA: SPOR domain-containing protein [Pseudolabrys sp.]|nr:SPOR domain-containing protein [Pseudolabrys sp.]
MAVEIIPQQLLPSAARTRRFDFRALWRLTAWGGAAALAVTAAAFVSQTEAGSRRLATLVGTEPAQAVATAQVPKVDPQVARLETQVRLLTADRDRLAERVASLEHNIDDLTGAIKRQAEQPAASPPQAAAPPPVIAAPATTEAAPPDKQPQQNAEAAPAAPAAEQAAPDAPHGAVPLPPVPPVRVAALPTAPAAPAVPARLEFGVALASSANIDVLHLQWTALKANFGPLLAGLRPSVAREQRGTSTLYRLVLGPLPNAAAAAKLCARLTAARAVCHSGRFASDPL